jgi:pyruvate oxidase
MSDSAEKSLTWFRVGTVEMLDEGRVTTVQAGHHAISLSLTEKGVGAISNRCAHQSGPLGDGFIENGSTCPSPLSC